MKECFGEQRSSDLAKSRLLTDLKRERKLDFTTTFKQITTTS